MKGLRGESGVPGIPAILPCQKKINLKKICFDPCPPGKQGPRGITVYIIIEDNQDNFFTHNSMLYCVSILYSIRL